jgi:CheY-like chemotaxis protein
MDAPLQPGPRRTVLVLNGYEDVRDLMRFALQEEGFAAVAADVDGALHGGVLKMLLEVHAPVVVVYDVAPPYDRSWLYLEALRSTGPLKNIPLVLTTTNDTRLRQLVAISEPLVEIFGKPTDLGQLVAAVHRAAGPA